MVNIEIIKDAIKREFKQSRPLMDTEDTKQTLLDWLTQIKFPAYPKASSWEECIQIFPSKPEDQKRESGLDIRLALRLYTKENTYLICIMECLNPESRGIYILTTHINWKADEWQVQKDIEERYLGEFNDMPRSRHIIWAQTFRPKELQEALNASAIAILGHELVGEHISDSKEEPVKTPFSQSVNFPAKDKD